MAKKKVIKSSMRKRSGADTPIMDEAQKWKKRIKRAEELQKSWRSEGRKRQKFVEGSQMVSSEDKQTPDTTWSLTTANRMHPLVNGLMASVIFRRPNVIARPIRKGEDAARRAQVNSTLLNYANRETKQRQAYKLAVHDAIIYGCGFIEANFDRERKIPSARWISAEDIIIDPSANTTMDSVSWIGYRFTMSIKAARKEFNNKSLQADSVGSTRLGREDDRSMTTSVGMKDKDKDQTSEKITLYRVWIRGDDPVAMDADTKSRDNKTEFGENRVIVFSPSNGKIVSDKSWPFILDHDEFPITIVRTHIVPNQILAWSPLKPVEQLQVQYNWAITYLVTQMRRTSQRKWLVNKNDFSEDEWEKIISPESDELIVVNSISPQSVQPIDFGSLSQMPSQMTNVLKNEFDEISGFNELFGGLRSARSATEAAIRDERAQTNVAMMQEEVEESVLEVERHKLQIAFSVMNTEDVISLLGEEMVQKVEIDQLQGQPFIVAEYWNEDMTPQQIRREVDIMLEPGSNRKVNNDQEFADTMSMLDRVIGLISQFANLGLQIQPSPLFDFVNSFLKRGMEKLGWMDGEQFLIPPETVGLPPEPQPNVNIREGNLTFNEGNTSLQEGNVSLREAGPAQPNVGDAIRAAAETGLDPASLQALLATETGR